MIVHNGITSTRHIPTVSDVKTCQAWVFISASNIPRDIDRVSHCTLFRDGNKRWKTDVDLSGSSTAVSPGKRS